MSTSNGSSLTALPWGESEIELAVLINANGLKANTGCRVILTDSPGPSTGQCWECTTRRKKSKTSARLKLIRGQWLTYPLQTAPGSSST